MTERKEQLFFLILLTFLPCLDGKLMFPVLPDVVYGAKNTDVVLPCNLTFSVDEPVELLMWYQGSTYVIFKDSKGNTKYLDPSLEDKYNIDDSSYSLSITSVVTKDTGNYTCTKSFKKFIDGNLSIVENSSTVQLIVQEIENITLFDDDDEDNVTVAIDVPSVPGMPVVDEVNSRDAKVTWAKSREDNRSPITNYIIHVKMDVMDDWGQSRKMLVDGNTTTIVVHNLQPYTPYKIRVIAKNALGNSVPSTPSSIFYTKPEEPSSPPRDFKGTSVESSKIRLTWKAPPDEAINGIPEGYKIEYIEVGSAMKRDFAIEDPSKQMAHLDNLQPFTNYTISIQLYNDVGEGPASTINMRTAEGVPEKPRITHYAEMKSTSFSVFWEAPKMENGVLKNYQLQWIHNNTYKTRIITGHLTNPMSAHISGLEPYNQYHLRVRAETGGGYSEYSNLFPAITDVAGPGPPTILNVTVLGPTMVFVQWEPPTIFYKKVDSFSIQFWSDGSASQPREEKTESTDSQRVIYNLETNNVYKLKIAGVTQSIFSQSYYIGEFSEVEEFVLGGTSVEDNTSIDFILTDPTAVAQTTVKEVVPAGMVAGVVMGVLFVTVAVLLFLGYKSMTCRKYTRSLYYLAVPTTSQSPRTTEVFPPETIEDTKYKEIQVPDFLNHIRGLHADSDNGFSTEFDDITSQTRTDLLAEASYSPENKAKNRYVNITAFDHSRVVLQPLPGKPKSDYINGNFIDGYNKPCAYIATQGPLPQTFADFWRMVWEQGTVVIIMITNLVERGRRKCDMYWLEEGSETYGSVTVKHINTFSRAHYTVRMFSLKSSKNKKKHVCERIVYQYHYTEWPDHGVPEFTLPVLKFIQKSASENPPGAGPIVIHCSAGVGRTGTYILIDTMIKQIKDKGTVNIPAFLLHIRQQRNFLVQTEEQYMLIHDAIAEYILTKGDTEVKEYDIPKYLTELTRQTNGEMSALDIQYSLVTSFEPMGDDMFQALKSVNRMKSRTLEMVPLSVKRVLLPVKPGVEGSDFINATYLQGYTKSNEFIITQHPLEQTVEDFWRMVWDQNSSVIVQLSDTDDEDFRSFWPEKDMSVDIGCFKLTYREDSEEKKHIVREFLLQSTQDDYILMTRIVRPREKWPESCHPLHQVFDLVDTVQTLHKQNDIGPVIVVDRLGGVEAATFCALWSIYDQMQFDKAINVYQLAKLYHLKRPGCVGPKENYVFLYRAAESLAQEWVERDRQSSPGSIRLQLGGGSTKKTLTTPRSVTINNTVETDDWKPPPSSS